MTGGFSFGDLKKGKKDKVVEFDSGSTGNTVTVVPTEHSPRGVSKDLLQHAPAKSRANWKKKYEDLEEFMNKSNKDFTKALETNKKAYEKLQAAFALSNENNSELQAEISATKKACDLLVNSTAELNDEVTMLRLQEEQMKKAIDILTIQAEKFKFRPHQYSEIARLLICMRVRGNRSQKEQVLKIVGSTAIEDVRDHIFKLLEAPYE